MSTSKSKSKSKTTTASTRDGAENTVSTREAAENIFITGSTGFLGGYVLTELLDQAPDAHFSLLMRAGSAKQADEKLWRSLQPHMDAAQFYRALARVSYIYGDLHGENLGIDTNTYEGLKRSVTSVLHIAASLNRKSSKACLNTNLRGTLSVVKLARAIHDTPEGGRLRRYSHVSTVAVAGHRDKEVVAEDTAIDWDRSDYDPYARTKKFCEHMAVELLPDVQKTFFRPSIVMGDSRFAETTQFDMVRAFCAFADLPAVPLRAGDRLDIVNADWVGHAIATLHLKAQPDHQIYHLSAGLDAPTIAQVGRAMQSASGKKLRFAPWLLKPFTAAVDAAASSRKRNVVTLVASLMKVFLPYVTWDTIFDNRRAVAEVGEAPTPFVDYCGPLYRFATRGGFKYPYLPLPPRDPADAADAADANAAPPAATIPTRQGAA